MTGTMIRRAGLAGAAVLVLLTAASPAAGVSGGEPAPAQGYEFAASIMVGDTQRACSGALVDPEWVITATSCLADGTIPAGPPPTATTATVGAYRLAVTRVVPHPSRDAVLLKLAAPIRDVTPIAIDTTAPTGGETLRVAGFGRTATEWVPERLHTAALTVRSVDAGTIGLSAPAETPATVCKGDAGGPALRPSGTSFKLAGLHHSSGQAGCLGTPASVTDNSTVETRLDDVADWVKQNVRGGNFVRLATSAGVLDTRSGIGAPAGARAAGTVTSFPVAGVGGIPAGVSAVLIDVTAITAASGGYLSVFGEGTPRDPALSMVNPAANQIISNTAVVPVPAGGKLSVFNNGAGEHIVIDVEGYYTTAPSTTGGGFVPVPYTRLVDTRSGIGGSTGVLNSGASRTWTLTGGVVPAGSSALMIDLIATGATVQGWVGTIPTGGTNRSVMDYVAGTTSHAVAVKLGPDGKATFTNNSGSPVHLVMTATGYWTSAATTGAGLRVRPAARLLDTRNVGDKAPLNANEAVDLPVNLPAGSTALLNFTVVDNAAAGFLRVWPTGETEPTASILNYPEAHTGARSSMAAVRVGADGKITIRNASAGTAHLIAEIQAWHAP